MRLLVTGSRDWWPPSTIWQWLGYYDLRTEDAEPLIVVHGDCPTGADRMAAEWVQAQRGRPWTVIQEPHRAQWRPYGIYNPQAGKVRNAHMVSLGADLCLAFIRNGSRGATHCAELAEQAGITTRRFTSDLRADPRRVPPAPHRGL